MRLMPKVDCWLKLRAVFADAKSDRVEGVRAAQAVVRQGPDLVFGSCDYDWGSPAVFEAQKAGKISVSYLCGGSEGGNCRTQCFHDSGVAQAQGIAMADWAIDKKGIRTAYVLLDDTSEYNKSVCGGFDWKFPLKGGKIIGREFQERGRDRCITGDKDQGCRREPGNRRHYVLLVPAGWGECDAANPCRGDQFAGAQFGLDGRYLLAQSVPGLTEFFIPVAVSIFGDDPRPEVRSLTENYKASSIPCRPPNMAFRCMPSWNCGLRRSQRQAHWNPPGLLLSSTLSRMNRPRLDRDVAPGQHIQMTAPLLIVAVSNDNGKVIDQVYDRSKFRAKCCTAPEICGRNGELICGGAKRALAES